MDSDTTPPILPEEDSRNRITALQIGYLQKAAAALAWNILAAKASDGSVIQVCVVCKHLRPQGHHDNCPIANLPGENEPKPNIHKPTLLVPRHG